MIKLSSLEDRVFSLEMPDGSVKKWDMISLGKKIYKLIGATGADDINTDVLLDKLDEFKAIFGLDISDSQMMSLLVMFVAEFQTSCGDMESDIKKKLETKSVE